MAALDKPRATPTRLNSNYPNRGDFPMATNTTIYMGALVCLNAAGYLVPGSTSTTLKAVGVLAEQPFEVPSVSIVNSGANGAKRAEVQMVTAKFDNDGADALTIADVTGPCYITDDQTVCKTATGKSFAGRVVGIDDATSPTGAGVWVAIGVDALGDGVP